MRSKIKENIFREIYLPIQEKAAQKLAGSIQRIKKTLIFYINTGPNGQDCNGRLPLFYKNKENGQLFVRRGKKTITYFVLSCPDFKEFRHEI